MSVLLEQVKTEHRNPGKRKRSETTKAKKDLKSGEN
jgi:hypothetical protein